MKMKIKKEWKEKINKFKIEALDVKDFIWYKLTTISKDYRSYKNRKIEINIQKQNIDSVVKCIDNMERTEHLHGGSLKDDRTCGYAYVGEMTTELGGPAPQLLEPTPGYRGPDAKPINDPDYKWKEKLG